MTGTTLQTPDRRYHRIGRLDPDYRWWKPLAVAGIGFVYFVVLSIAVGAASAVVAIATLGIGPGLDLLVGLADPSQPITSPIVLGTLLASIAVLLPALVLARLTMRLSPIGALSSVAGRLRWRWLLVSAVPAIAYVGVGLLFGFVVVPIFTGDDLGVPTVPPGTYAASLVVIVLLVPLQAAAEEYVFRGFLLQAVGGWVRFPFVAIVASAVPFMLGHLYNLWGLLEVLVFGLVTAWVVIATGGLEAAIVVHTINNAAIFAVSALGFTGLTSTDGTPWSLLATLVLMPLYAVFVVRSHKRMFGPRSSTDGSDWAPPSVPPPTIAP